MADAGEPKGRWSRRVSTMLDADETLRQLNQTIVRMNRTLDEFDGVLSGFSVALQDFVTSVEGFDRVVERMDGNLIPRVDAIVARAESILSGAALPALGAHVLSSFRKSVAGVAAVAGVRGAAAGRRELAGAAVNLPYDVESHVPSLQSRAWNAVLRPTFKQLTRILPGSRFEIQFIRAISEWGSVLAGADAIPHTRVSEPSAAGDVRGEWVGSAPDPGDKVMLYSHGSAYTVCSPRTHRAFVAALSRRTGRRAFSLDYRLGPEHRFPAAHEDVVAAYLWLLDRGHRPEDIILAGDSAGGHLSLSLCGELRRRGLVMPAALVLFSPLVDGSFAAATEEYRRNGDPMVVPGYASRLIRHYFRTATAGDPRFDVSLDAGPDVPPTLIISGKGEMMRGDALLWQRAQREAGSESCEVQIWPAQAHVFPMFGLVPEARLTMAEVARFVAQVDDGWFDGDRFDGDGGDERVAAEA